MVSPDLLALLKNMNSDQLGIIEAIAIRVAIIPAEKYTGEISFSVHASQGAVGDLHVNRKEIIRCVKKRGVRNGGII